MLKNTASLPDVLRHAIHNIASEPTLKAHLLQQLSVPRMVPSTATLLRHRLTIHMALALSRYIKDVNERALRSGMGMFR